MAHPVSTEYLALSATAAVAAMKDGSMRAEEYASALLAQAQRAEPLNAFRTLDPEAVLEASRAADLRRDAGADLGLLHGLPVPIKDSVNTKGIPTSNGTASLRDFRPANDASVVSILRSHGAIMMGKTNLHELSLGWTSDNSAFGAVHNPHDQTRIPGGSSGGSAVAVAAHLAPVAIAEDTLGSIRIPASMCGVYGFRPTRSRYANDGVMLLTRDFDQIGTMARTVGDLALFDSALAGDTSTLPTIDLRSVRIGVADFFLTDLDSEVERVTEETIRRLQGAGVTIVRADVPDDVKHSLDAALAILMSEVGPAIGTFLATQNTGVSFGELASQFGPDLQALFSMPPLPAGVYEAMLVQRERVRQATLDYFASHNVAALLHPPAMIPPYPIGADGSRVIGERTLPNTVTMGRNVSPASCGGLASVVLPAGMTGGGLPVGIEFDAPVGSDRRLLAIAAALEAQLHPKS